MADRYLEFYITVDKIITTYEEFYPWAIKYIEEFKNNLKHLRSNNQIMHDLKETIINNGDPLILVEAIRNSFYGSYEVYMNGSCHRLYDVLKAVYPDAIKYGNEDHVITRIRDLFFDIRGVLPYDIFKEYEPMEDTKEDHMFDIMRFFDNLDINKFCKIRGEIIDEYKIDDTLLEKISEECNMSVGLLQTKIKHNTTPQIAESIKKHIGIDIIMETYRRMYKE